MFTNLLSKSRFQEWISYMGPTYWSVFDGSWNVGGWYDSETIFSSERIAITVNGAWAHDIRPDAMRLTFTGMTPATARLVQLADTLFDNIININIPTPPGTPSFAELPITWGTHDLETIELRSYDGSDPFKLTNVEFGFS